MMHDEEVIDGLLDKIAALKAERDAAVRELELVTAERNRAHRACEQISVRLHAAQAERDELKAQRQPLSDEQLREALRQCPHDTVANLRSRWLDAKYFARAIEAAHNIGGDK